MKLTVPTWRNSLILVADDDAANRRFASRTLSAAGWPVEEASDGVAAVEAAMKLLPSLIVMDIEMPGCDGIEATRRIRAASAPLRSVPILAYTMRELSDDAVRAYGMDGRIAKPLAPDDLLATVGCWTEPAGVNDSDRLAAVFGQDEIAELLSGLRDQLLEGVQLLDQGRGDTVAHRIAGAAGTLGFAAVSASWLSFSEGHELARDIARRDARMAIASIDRDDKVCR